VVITLFHLLFIWDDKSRAFWRDRLPQHLQHPRRRRRFRCRHLPPRFPLQDSNEEQLFPRATCSVPVKLFYTSNMPIMLQSALRSNIFILSQMLYSRFPDNILVRVFGVWELTATSGICTPPCAQPLRHSKTYSHRNLRRAHGTGMRVVFKDLDQGLIGPCDCGSLRVARTRNLFHAFAGSAILGSLSVTPI